MVSKVFTIIFLVYMAEEIWGHGMMLQPPGRSSVWRFYDNQVPENYNDNELFCGGVVTQHEIHGGQCGVCGDPYHEPHPQANENTGKYGKGIVVAYYEPGEVIDVMVRLTANHLGSFSYSLCELEDHNAPESGEECFQPLLFEDGSENFPIGPNEFNVYNRIVLPDKECERCVLRWTYRTGNSWGVCDNGEQGIGCGPQEHFRSCADIKIRKATKH